MATLNSSNLYELDDKVTLGLHLGAGASDGYIVEAGSVLYTDSSTSYTSVQDAIDSIAANVTSATVSNEDGSIVVSQTSSGTTISVNVDGITTLLNEDGTLATPLYGGSNAISVTNYNDYNRTISLTISSSDNILSQSSSGLIANLSVTKVTSGLDDNVKEQYNIVGKNSTVIGSIPIYKDSSLYSVEMGYSDAYLEDNTDPGSLIQTIDSGDALVFIYLLSDGTYEAVAIDLSEYLKESEFGNGLAVNNGTVSVAAGDGIEVSSTGVSVAVDGDTIQINASNQIEVYGAVSNITYTSSTYDANAIPVGGGYFTISSTNSDTMQIIYIPIATANTYGLITTTEVQDLIDTSVSSVSDALEEALTWIEV